MSDIQPTPTKSPSASVYAVAALSIVLAAVLVMSLAAFTMPEIVPSPIVRMEAPKPIPSEGPLLAATQEETPAAPGPEMAPAPVPEPVPEPVPVALADSNSGAERTRTVVLPLPGAGYPKGVAPGPGRPRPERPRSVRPPAIPLGMLPTLAEPSPAAAATNLPPAPPAAPAVAATPGPRPSPARAAASVKAPAPRRAETGTGGDWLSAEIPRGED